MRKITRKTNGHFLTIPRSSPALSYSANPGIRADAVICLGISCDRTTPPRIHRVSTCFLLQCSSQREESVLIAAVLTLTRWRLSHTGLKHRDIRVESHFLTTEDEQRCVLYSLQNRTVDLKQQLSYYYESRYFLSHLVNVQSPI